MVRLRKRSRSAGTPVGSTRATNIRRALEGEGADEAEIESILEELMVEEDGGDPLARARKAGIPGLYLDVPWDEIEPDGRKQAILRAKEWARAAEGGRRDVAEQTPAGLYLWSEGDRDEDVTGFGTGKTWIAAAAAHHLLAHGVNVRWLTVTRLMTDLNLSYKNPQHEVASRRVREPRPGEAIVLDDIDKQPPTDRNIQPIYALVNDCVNNAVPLLITANRHADDLQADWGDRFGHAAASRVIGHCLDVEVRGRDRRLA